MADDATAARNPEVDYERSDVGLPLIGILAVLTVVWLIAVPALLAWGYPQALRDADKALHIVPPEPRLQVDPNADLVAFRQREEQRLTSYGWVDRDKGIVHIPIDVALAKVAREGIPDWPGQANQAQAQDGGAPK